MKKFFNKGMTLAIAAVMVLSSIGIVSAMELPNALGTSQDRGIITPYWTGISTLYYDLKIISGGAANPIIKGTMNAGEADSVNVSVALKRSNGSGWTTIKTWNQDKAISANQFSFNETYSVLKGYDYKFSATVKSYKNNALVDTVNLCPLFCLGCKLGYRKFGP